MGEKRYSLELETMNHGVILIQKFGDKRIDSWYFKPADSDLDIIQIIRKLLGREKRSDEEIVMDNFQKRVTSNFESKKAEIDMLNKRLDTTSSLIKKSVDQFKTIVKEE